MILLGCAGSGLQVYVTHIFHIPCFYVEFNLYPCIGIDWCIGIRYFGIARCFDAPDVQFVEVVTQYAPIIVSVVQLDSPVADAACVCVE